MTYDEIVGGLRDSVRELQDEGRMVWAGLKAEQDTAGIIERYAWLYSDDALAASGELSGEEGRRVRAAILKGIVERRTAVHDDRLGTFYAGATARAGDEELPFYTAQAELAREPRPARRDALGEAVVAVQERADELALALNAAALDAIRELGYDSYVAFWSDLKQVDYAPLRAEVARVAGAARDRYRAWVEPRMERAGHRFGECPQWHVSFIRGLSEHDAAFTAARFEPAMRRTFERLGLELFAAPTIHLDLDDRPAKNPRACVWVPEAGREVHLLTRPSGGNTDYSAFLHEAGHALHFGLADPAIGWPLANLGRSMAYAELWSFLFERVGHDPAWIADATGCAPAEAETIAADLTGVDLMMFLRYAGKLACELDLYAGDALDVDRGRRLYADTMTAGTGFRHDGRAWQFDRDQGLYSADYLRAWLAEAALDRWLRASMGERWWAGAEAGRWLRAQWRRGWLPEAEEAVAEAGGVPWSGEPLLDRLRRRLPAGPGRAGAALPEPVA